MKKFLFGAAAALILATGSPTVLAQGNYPTRPIRLIVPFPPGNSVDIMARVMAPHVSERLGQQLVVDNRPGASGMLGTDQIAKAAPDGYTIGAAQSGTMVTLPHTSKEITYNALKDLVPIALSATNYLAIVTSPNAPFKTLQEMVAYARANPQKLTVATNGEGGFPHLSFELLRSMGGFSYTHVPYKGSSQIATDLIGGQVQASIDGISGVAPQVRAGRLKLIAITNKSRVATWPDTPVAGETVPGYEASGWFGYIAPPKTPVAIIKRLNEEFNRAVKLPDVVETLNTAGLIVVAESPEKFGDRIKSDYAKYGKLVKDIGFKPQ